MLVCRNTEFYGDEHLGSTATGNYDDSLESRREVLEQENPETAQEHQYTFTQSEPEYAYENAKQQLNTAYDASQANAQSQMQNLASLSNVMVSYMCIAFHFRTRVPKVLKILVIYDSFFNIFSRDTHTQFPTLYWHKMRGSLTSSIHLSQ